MKFCYKKPIFGVMIALCCVLMDACSNTKSGVSDGLSDLPLEYADYFRGIESDLRNIQIHYIWDRSEVSFYMKAEINSQTFESLSESNSFVILKYEKGFNLDSPSPYSSFNPKGNRVYVSSGKPHPESRRLIIFYFEPIDDKLDNVSGTLYAHIRS